MIILAGSNSHPISKKIQRLSWSDCSHVGIYDPDDNTVIEAVGPELTQFILILLKIIKNDIKYGGVVKTPLEEFKAKYPTLYAREIPGDINKARAKVGTLYDVWGIIGAWFHLELQNPDELFCTEVLAESVTTFDKEFAHKCYPSWFVAFSKPVDINTIHLIQGNN